MATVTTTATIDALIAALIASPGDHLARHAMADAALELCHPSAVGHADVLRMPGQWHVYWRGDLGRYVVLWQPDEGDVGVWVGSVRRKHAPRCHVCNRYQPIASEAIGWKWTCGECLGRAVQIAHARAVVRFFMDAKTACFDCGGTGHDKAGRWCLCRRPATTPVG